MEKTCFIPISVSNSSFRTEIFAPALRAIDVEYSKCVFFIAESLQIYNKATQADSAKELVKIIRDFRSSSYLEERRRWIERLHKDLSNTTIGRAEWHTVGIDAINQDELLNIFRTLAVVLSVDKRLFELVQSDATAHNISQTVKGDEITRLRLSILYLLDELSVNLYFHTVLGYSDEYYIDGVLGSIAALYDGSLGVSATELVESVGLVSKEKPFDFYKYDRANGRWEKSRSLTHS